MAATTSSFERDEVDQLVDIVGASIGELEAELY
jgi:hypothetical protein